MVEPSDWKPEVGFDIKLGTQKALDLTIEKFDEWRRANPPTEPLPLTSGWHDINPQLAENLLRRNNSNRKPSFRTLLKYAEEMEAGQWMPTGQSVLLNAEGKLEDGQHRLFAAYFGGYTFRTHVVTDAPVIDRVFAYIDRGKPRTLSDAIFTAGSNGLAATISGAVKIAWRYDHNAFAIMKQQPKLRDITSIETLNYLLENPLLKEVAHVMAGTYQPAMKVIANKGIAVFVAFKIAQLHGQAVLDDFLVAVGTGAELAEDDPILGLRNRLAAIAYDKKKTIGIGHRLGLVIKAFNMFMCEEKVGKKGFHLRDNEDFPRFEEARKLLPEAAE